MNKAKNTQASESPKILSPRDSYHSELKVDQGSLTPERIEKELESTLVRDLEALVKRLSKLDFS